MKTKLLKKIRKNIFITRTVNKYSVEIKNGFCLKGAGATALKDYDKGEITEIARSLILYVARINFKRKSVKLY